MLQRNFVSLQVLKVFRTYRSVYQSIESPHCHNSFNFIVKPSIIQDPVKILSIEQPTCKVQYRTYAGDLGGFFLFYFGKERTGLLTIILEVRDLVANTQERSTKKSLQLVNFIIKTCSISIFIYNVYNIPRTRTT